MRIIFTLTFFLIAQVSCAQINLVPNPSFEDTIACPNNFFQINNAVGWMGFGGSPDYQNICSNFIACTIPSNWFGYQYPRTGSAYAGIITNDTPPPGNYREYIACQLYDTLIVGQTYYLCFWISAGYNLPGSFELIRCFSNNIGARLSTIAYSNFIPDNYSQIYTTTIANDTTNWVKVSGSFVADSAYTYLIIGNFFDDLNTQFVCDTNNMNAYSYYYIDDVVLSDDSIICTGSTGIVYLISKKQFSIFPTPADHSFIVRGDLSKIKAISIINELGQIEKEINSTVVSSGKINVADLPQGFYFISLITKENRISYPLIIIHK